MLKERISNKLSKYRFEIRHITILFTVLILFQIVLTIVQKSSLEEFLEETQNWYQKHSAERLAIVTSASLELLFENLFVQRSLSDFEERKIITSFNVIFKQQLVQQSVQDICIILVKNHRIYVIDTGQKLHMYFTGTLEPYTPKTGEHTESVEFFLSVKNQMKLNEVIHSKVMNRDTFDLLVPFVPNGEYLGVMYMRIKPDFDFLTEEISSGYDKVAIVYTTLIFIGLIAIFLVSSQAVKERNEAQQRFFKEHEENLKKEIRLEKEHLFTKRIYHTHHKAEKIMGFIKEDVRRMDVDNLDCMKSRVITYSNFISRIIYDMKWYDQDVNTIINPMFRTNVNSVIEFIVENVFLRISSKNEMFEFDLRLDDRVPAVNINEYIVWEILEPVIQNSIDHGDKKEITVKIQTKYDERTKQTFIKVADNGVGIREELLEKNEKGIQKIFLENESTKTFEGANSGYGCYIAYQMAVGRCGWKMNAENLPGGGCQFTITFSN